MFWVHLKTQNPGIPFLIEPKASKSTVIFGQGIYLMQPVQESGLLVWFPFFVILSSSSETSTNSRNQKKTTNKQRPLQHGECGCLRLTPIWKARCCSGKLQALSGGSFSPCPFPSYPQKVTSVYLEADKFSQESQSYKLVGQPFCAQVPSVVAFSYHMDGRGRHELQASAGSPAGQPPSSLWERVGSQGPDWLSDSMAIPSGHQQPMQR